MSLSFRWSKTLTPFLGLPEVFFLQAAEGLRADTTTQQLTDGSVLCFVGFLGRAPRQRERPKSVRVAYKQSVCLIAPVLFYGKVVHQLPALFAFYAL